MSQVKAAKGQIVQLELEIRVGASMPGLDRVSPRSLSGMNPFLALCLLLTMSACASKPSDKGSPDEPFITAGQVGDALKQPLKDLNVMQGDIPPVLLSVRSAPYAQPAADDCPTLNGEIAELDHLLGPDFDAAPAKDETTSKIASQTVLGATRDTASSWIPFRSVVRRITGAEKRNRTISQAQLAGSVRRAYLKGMGQKMGCEYPAAPLREVAQP